MIDDALVPGEQRIFDWIDEVFGHGIRLPGYPADRWAESWLQEQFAAFGLERVRAEPVETMYWEPRRASLTITADDERIDIPCFQMPHTATGDIDAALADIDDASAPPGAIAVRDVPLIRPPFAYYQHVATWHYDPAGTFEGSAQVLPFGAAMMEAMAPALEARAAAFIGILSDYPGDSYRYYVPYDAEARPIPGVWIRGRDGARLRAMMQRGPVRARLIADADRRAITSYNVVGELPATDDETVIVGSHHDGPWASAVEDASGIALVLAQIAYWSRVPASERPHRMVFLLNAGHMAGGAGQAAFVREHREALDRAVLHVHLEHVAAEFAERDGALAATGEPEARWWFTTQLPHLEATVRDAIEAEGLARSFILRPDIFGEKPTTDGADFHLAGVPLVHHLAAPFYLFDEMDTLDKIHRPSLVPVTRATIRILESTRGISAAAMRAGVASTS